MRCLRLFSWKVAPHLKAKKLSNAGRPTANRQIDVALEYVSVFQQIFDLVLVVRHLLQS
jgi:hypothetical protein